MTQEEIISGNKLIHEFMGWKWFDKRYPRNHGIGAPEAFENTNDIIIQKAKYHTSWDWLMPVVEKCIYMPVPLSISDTGEKLSINIQRKLSYAKMQPVYNAVIQFITWYNSQQH